MTEALIGLECPICRAASKVVDSRGSERIRRRRVCQGCGHRFSTLEIAVAPEARVLKQHGRPSELFDSDKIRAALARISKDGLLEASRIDEIARKIEAQLRESGRPWLDSLEIAQQVAELLRVVEPRAAHRFLASYDGEIRPRDRTEVGQRKGDRKVLQRELPFSRLK